MTYRYFHDEQRRLVIRMPAEPTVIEQKDRNGRRTGWVVQSEQEITRADNALKPNSYQWKYRVRSNPQENYGSRDDRGKVIQFFNTQHVPNLPEIDEDTYRRLQRLYEQEARKNSCE